jgi:hypothetical protein
MLFLNPPHAAYGMSLSPVGSPIRLHGWRALGLKSRWIPFRLHVWQALGLKSRGIPYSAPRLAGRMD